MSRRGFTLVEMLVVIGIIGVLAALLLPAVMAAVNIARRSSIAVDLGELDKAVNSYREKKGDAPPNFRDYNAFIRHVNKCYPRIDPVHLNRVIQLVWNNTNYSTSNPPPLTTVPMLDEGESLVFWLYLVDNDNRLPFKAILVAFRVNPVDYTAMPINAGDDPVKDVINAAKSPEHIYTFKEERFVDGSDTDYMPAYKASYAGESAYLYLDSRSYDNFTDDYTSTVNAAYSEDLLAAGYVRPYWTKDRKNNQTIAGTDMRPFFKAKKETDFQIICAGQDGLFGEDVTNPASLRYFPSGDGYNISGEDNDNMTNFSEGRRLQDFIE